MAPSFSAWSYSLRHSIEISPLTATGWKIGIIFENRIKREDLWLKGIVSKKPTEEILAALKKRIGEDTERFDTSNVYSLAKAVQGGKIEQLVLPKEGTRAMLLLRLQQDAPEKDRFQLYKGPTDASWEEVPLSCAQGSNSD